MLWLDNDHAHAFVGGDEKEAFWSLACEPNFSETMRERRLIEAPHRGDETPRFI
jgi:lipocalin